MASTTKTKALLLGQLLILSSVLAACGNDSNSESAVSPSASASGSAAAATSAAPAESAPASEEASAYPLTVTDELGHTITIPAKPERVFAPTMEDSLLALGVTPAIQWSNGVEPQNYLQDLLAGVPEISYGEGSPSFEAILEQEPDLIVLHNSYYADEGLYEQYSKIAPTYAFKSASEDLDGAIRTLGQLLGEEAKAEEAKQQYSARVEAAKTQLGSLSEGKRAAIIRFNAKGMFFMNSGYFSGYVLTHELGFGESNLVTEGAFEVSLEALPTLDADYIFLINDGHLGDAALKSLKISAVWNSLAAVKEGRVFETNADYWLSGGYIAQGKVVDDVVGFLTP
ncbi:ABC transporter substrate-binding protein [Cohnella fermenti]|uniref:ABC transporter substrate-binding protein n=1 Tax=Cohnella fermenti TaxID=2565925 RepID=UPI001B3B2D70|nr:ABC transporter substrate-binding protein [Cohnella fermenti]